MSLAFRLEPVPPREFQQLWPKGGFHWSKLHNSNFETSKLTLVDFSQSKTVDRPPLTLHGTVIPTQKQHKFVGAVVDQELRWKQHMTYATAKATKWVLAFRHLTHPSIGICPHLMQQMFITVAIPKMAYAADIWYMPIYQFESKERRSSSIRVTQWLASIQRLATTAVTGVLRSTATDVLDLHAHVFPTDLSLQQVCHRAAVQLATLPPEHPLASLYCQHTRQFIKSHHSHLHDLASFSASLLTALRICHQLGPPQGGRLSLG